METSPSEISPFLVGNLGTGLIVSYFNGDLCENCQGDPYRNTVVVIVCAQGMAGNPDDFLVEPFTPVRYNETKLFLPILLLICGSMQPNSRTAVSFRHQAGCVKFIAAPSTGGLSAGSVMLIMFVPLSRIICAFLPPHSSLLRMQHLCYSGCLLGGRYSL